MPKSPSYCVALQPICDREMIHVADELLYRSTSMAPYAQIDDDLVATARVCNAAFYETGIEKLCGNRKLFFNAPREWILNPELLPPYPDRVVLEVLESVKGDYEVIEALKHVKFLGYQIALDDFELCADTEPLLEIADIVKIDMLTYQSEGEIDYYLSKGLTLLAEKVEDLEVFEDCKRLGFSLFQGYFYAKAEVKSATSVKRSSNAKVRLEILKELYKEDVDFEIVESLLVQEPQLVLRLLKMINSAYYKRVNTVHTLHQAVTLLGIQKLRTLVSTLVLANDHPCKMLLLPKVLTRASMCRILAERHFKVEAEEAFLVGLLSLSDLMLDQSLKEICDQLPLSDKLYNALLFHEGKIGRILTIVISFENAKLNLASEKTVEMLNSFYLESRSWALSILTGMKGDG
ncbi:EAL and HDOD domain-containing protein [Marinomonas fungiae]|uniref:C-di-GMP-related signal transduction protein, contains EAL and HDOD domains n=1 Tax=Marinomonas fungiae TaxID=1137284 RepID=A0A0K6IUX0_9GAMM|nr:HDOD domain-containing protein [Marinomonas fungiae]CUB06869.1 c-di-GMP-related signal transduction protein, contains EAL and HDOD domains [Marinomonas fungiae]